jgi:hypothetical protein
MILKMQVKKDMSSNTNSYPIAYSYIQLLRVVPTELSENLFLVS